MLIFNGSSFGQGVGGGGAPPPAPSWNFDFTQVLFDVEYALIAAQAGPPMIPAHRQISSTAIRLEGGKIFNVANINPTDFKINIFDGSSNLIWSQSSQYQQGGTIFPITTAMPNGEAVTPPVTIRVDLKSDSAIWYLGAQVMTVGSATETTSWTAKGKPNWRVDTLTTWSYKIPTPNALPDMRVALENIKNPNDPWQMHANVWESTWNADSSFGFWSFDGFLVEQPYRLSNGPPGYGGNAQTYTYFMSAILAKQENPVGILYPGIGYCTIGP